jgi:hypothetical protein
MVGDGQAGGARRLTEIERVEIFGYVFGEARDARSLLRRSRIVAQPKLAAGEELTIHQFRGSRGMAGIYHMLEGFNPSHFSLERRPAHPLWFQETGIDAPVLILQGCRQLVKLIHGPLERRAALRPVCEPVSLPRCEGGSARWQVEFQDSAPRQRTHEPPSPTPKAL